MFKYSFKYYKSKNPPPNFEEVLDFQKPSEFEGNGIVIYQDLALNSPLFNYGLKHHKYWTVYQIQSKNGFILIRNPFTPAGQRYWIKKCLKEYSRKPNKLNIDNCNVPTDTNWWDAAQNDKTLLQSLRWATFGYHHNWDTKIYSEENRSGFPSDLKAMTEYIAQKLGFMDFTAEAAIVNYYQFNSSLSGHTDHSEQNLEAPLFSFSFGQTAVFLLGGKTIDEKPTAMFLRSGDVLIMSKQSRLCYHGVPRVIPTEHDVWNDEDDFNLNNDYYEAKDALWTPFNNYLSHSRINMNVRQVLNTGQLKLCH